MESLDLKQSWYLCISDEYDAFCKKVDGKTHFAKYLVTYSF